MGGAVLFISLLATAPKPAALPKAVDVPLRLEVLLVNDPQLPPVTRAQAEVILREAEATLADKLSFKGLNFALVGEQSVEEFLAHTNGSAHQGCLEQFEPQRVRPDGRMPRDIPKGDVLRFLNRWDVEALRAFFPEELRANLTSYNAIYEALMDELTRKLKLIASFKLPNGKSLLDPSTLDQRSYVRWICAVRYQNRADLVLTNAFLLYDLGSEPYPHSIFAKNKVGGASLHSETRTAIANRAVIASTFSMSTSLDFFREEGIETLQEDQRLAVIGTFIVAHELGHALFKLPDFYNHPKECLMTTKYETGYVSGYHNIKRYPGACTQCTPYVVAKRHAVLADNLERAGKYQEAITEMKEAIRLTPKHIDGSYLRYVAGLSVRVAELYMQLGDHHQAERWLKSALRIVPDHTRALALKVRIDKPK